MGRGRGRGREEEEEDKEVVILVVVVYYYWDYERFQSAIDLYSSLLSCLMSLRHVKLQSISLKTDSLLHWQTFLMNILEITYEFLFFPTLNT